MKDSRDSTNRAPYWNRYWSRRGAIGASAGAVAIGLVGCGGGDDDDDTGSNATQAPGGSASPGASTQAVTPKTGGILRQVGVGDPSTFDLHQNISVVVSGPAAPMFNGLLQMNPHKDGDIIPDLALALPEQADATTVIFRIAPDIKFHDGSTLTAEDIKANYEWMIKPPAGKTSTRQSILGPVVDSIETPDATTVRFKLKNPSASFLLNQTVEYMAIGPKKVLDADGELGKNPIGTGPFTRKSYQAGVSVELEKNPNYFRKGLPYLDGMVIHILADRRTALENFLAGKVHMISPSAEETSEIKSRLGDKVVLTDAASNARNMLFMNTSKAPFNDPRVREALSLLFDREEHTALVYQGRGGTISGYMAPKPNGVWSLDEAEIKKVSGYNGADVTKAKALLAQAGVNSGTTWKMVSRNIYENLAVWCVEQLRKAGISATPQLLDTGAAYAAGNEGNFDLFPWTAVPALDDPDAVLGDIGGMTFAVRNWSKTNDPEVDRLYNEQTKTLDATARKKLVNDLDRKLVSTFQTLQFGYSAPTYAHYKEVMNKTYLMNENYTNRTYEDIWLNS